MKEKYNHRASRAGTQNLLQSYQKGSHYGFYSIAQRNESQEV